MLSRRNRRTPIGVDIGENGTRTVQLVRNGDHYAVAHAARCERAVTGTDAEDHPGELKHWTKSCIRQAEFRGSDAVVGLNTPDVEFHALELPNAAPAETDRMVGWEVARLMTDSEQEVETRHWMLPPTQVTAPNAIGVAATRNVVARTLGLCKDVNLNCLAVDTGATALCRFGTILNKWHLEVVWAVLDLGFRETRLIVCSEDIPLLVRSVGTGGGGWTKRIAESLQTSIKTAEVQKCGHGIAAPAGQIRDGAGGASPTLELSSLILGILRSNLNDMALEVKRSYEYVLSSYPKRRAGDLILVGGGASMRNLPDFLTDSLGIPVRRASSYLGEPSCRLRCKSSKQEYLDTLALATGLALQG